MANNKNLDIIKVFNTYVRTESMTKTGENFSVSRSTISRLLNKHNMIDDAIEQIRSKVPNTQLKFCIMCKKCKHKNNFYGSCKARDGLLSECLDCYKIKLNNKLKNNNISIKYLQDQYFNTKSITKVADKVNMSKYLIKVILDIYGVLNSTREKIRNKDKRCNGCGVIKPINGFSLTKNGYPRSYCKKCRRKVAKEYRKNNPEIMEIWRSKNKDHINRYTRNYTSKKLKNDINFKISAGLRKRLYAAIKNNQKVGSAVKDLGCSIEYLKNYLENKFYYHSKTKEQMTWKNYGLYGWHIDHIIPLSKFNLTDRKQFLRACHYTNLQPLWAKENLVKGSKYNV